MSYNQTHQMKQFVKAKPLTELKDKPPPVYPRDRDPKRNNKKYEEKSFQQNKDPREHIKVLLNEFQVYEKNQDIVNLCAKFPRFFSEKSSKPEPETQSTLTEYVVMGGKKEPQPKVIRQMSSDSSDPDWDSDEDKEVKLVSKKIKEEIVEKINTVTKKQPAKRLDDLQRHEKQFLEEYYRRKRLEEQNAIQNQQLAREAKKQQKKNDKVEAKEKEKADKIESKPKEQEEEWAEYDPKVGALITGGFIQKVEKGEEDDFEMDDDFSYEQQKSPKQSSSSEDDDDMFADEGPRTITKTKTIDEKKEEESKKQRREIVQIASHTFSQIAQSIGALPESCTWIISNKNERYRLSTQYMNEYYQNLSKAFPYISLNHSEFVHHDEIQTEKGLEKLRKSDHRRRTQNSYNNKNKPAVPRPQAPHYKQKK